MFVARIKPSRQKSPVRRKAASHIRIPENEIVIKFVLTGRYRGAGNFEWLRDIFERRVPSHLDLRAILKVERQMVIDVPGLETAAGINNVVDLPMRTDIANEPVPSLRTPRITGDGRKSLNAD